MFGLEIECKLNAWIKEGQTYHDPQQKWRVPSDYPILYKTDQGFAIHVDHDKGMPGRENTDEKGDEGPIIELVNNPPVKVWEDEDKNAEIFRNMKKFWEDVKIGTGNFTQRCQLKSIYPDAPDCIYIGSDHKKSPVVERQFDIQVTYGVRLDRIKYLFELISDPVGEEEPAPADPEPAVDAGPDDDIGVPGPPPPPPAIPQVDNTNLKHKSYSDALIWAEELRKLVWWKYKDKKYSFDVNTGKKKKRFFANRFKVKSIKDLDELEGFFALLLNYLIVGMQPTGSKKGWSKNYVGQLLYKTDLADIRKELNKICNTLLKKRSKKIRKYIMEASNRVNSEGVLYQYELKRRDVKKMSKWQLFAKIDDGSRRRVSVENWLDDIMKGKSDLMLMAVKNPYASSLTPKLETGKIGVVTEHRSFGRLVPSDTVNRIPANWEEIGIRTYKMLRELNGESEPDLQKIRDLLRAPVQAAPHPQQAAAVQAPQPAQVADQQPQAAAAEPEPRIVECQAGGCNCRTFIPLNVNFPNRCKKCGHDHSG
jgi:hypothetical protein